MKPKELMGINRNSIYRRLAIVLFVSICGTPFSVLALDNSIVFTASTAISASSYTGWVEDGEGKHWVDNGSFAVNKEVRDPSTGKWYYFDSEGRMVSDSDVWLDEGQKWVRYGDDGAMVKGEDHRVSPVDGQWHWWYFDPYTGAMAKGLTDIPSGTGSKTVLYDEACGWMLYGEQCVSGNWYLFNGYTGEMTRDSDVWLDEGQKWVRYGDDGAMVKGEDHRVSPVDGQWHWWYFDPYTGAMAKGLTDIPSGTGSKTVLYDEACGWMLYGKQYIGSDIYLFDNQTGQLIGKQETTGNTLTDEQVGEKIKEIIRTAESLESKNSGLWYASVVTVQPNNTQLPLRCDGFTAYVYYLCDVQAWESYSEGANRWDNSSMGTYGGYKGQLKYIESLGRLVRNINDLEVGDIVFYGQNDSNLRHAAIYKGNGIIIHAADSQHGITEGPVSDLGDFVAGGSPLNHG